MDATSQEEVVFYDSQSRLGFVFSALPKGLQGAHSYSRSREQPGQMTSGWEWKCFLGHFSIRLFGL